MHKLLFVFFISCITICSAQVPSAIEWQKTIGGSGSDVARGIEQTSDGGYIVAGQSSSTYALGQSTGNHGGNDFWVVKLDNVGNVLWTKSLGGSVTDNAEEIHETNDGGFILTGTSSSNDGDVTGAHGSNDHWVVKLDGQGNLQWENAFGGSGSDVARSIQQTSDGGYIFVGNASSNDGDVSGVQGPLDGWVVKLDAAGALQWQNALGGTDHETFYSVKEVSTGGYIAVGQTSSNDGDVTGNNGGTDVWVVKLDAAGTLVWQNALGGSATDTGYEVVERPTGEFVITGKTQSNDGDVTMYQGAGDMWVFQLDAQGVLQWQNTFGGSASDHGTSLHTTADGGTIVAGVTFSNDGDVTGNHGASDYWVVRLDGSGNLLWQNALGGSSPDEANSIALADNGYIVAGGSGSVDGDVTGNNTNSSYFWVVKLTDDYALLTGKMFTDLNNNSIQDPLELGLANQLITNTTNGNLYSTEQSGAFAVPALNTGTTVIAPSAIPYYSAQPATHSANFPTLLQQVDAGNDFAMQPTGNFNDLEVSITPLGFFRPGFAAQYAIDYRNIGTTSLVPELVFIPDASLSFDSSSVAPTATFADSVQWQFPSLAPYASGQFNVFVTVDQNTVLGDTLITTARIDPTMGDAAIWNNLSSAAVLVQGSYDPNDITVDRTRMDPSEFPMPPALNYLIRFQNTGTDTAFTVKVRNALPVNAEQGSFHFQNSSHPVELDYDNATGEILFQLNNILLPDSGTNEPESHGYIRYYINPISTLQLGDSILNQAAIYFDYNVPVITNTAVTVIETSTAVEAETENHMMVLSPNPTNGIVLLQLNQTMHNAMITLTDAVGREVLRESTMGNAHSLDLRDIPKGVYLLNLRSDEGRWSERLVLK